MIKIKDKRLCCGCSACIQKCPKHCIVMQEDDEGFLYPKIDKSMCIDCHLCEKVCPCLNQKKPREALKCYAAFNLNETVRNDSSSGGIFTELAEKVINDGGVVFGARFNDKWKVIHSYTETISGLAKFRGSKYVQSFIGNTYKEAELFLKQGRKVLFSGTPCQIAGLRLFLRKEYENLLAVDFICHGVPSPGVFRWYLQEELDSYASKNNCITIKPLSSIRSIPKGDILIPEGIEVKNIRFRDKKEGWKKYSFALLLAEATADGKKNTVSLSSTLKEHPFLRGFLRNLYLRPSCSFCPSKNIKSGSDITMADFWGSQNIAELQDDDKGLSAIMINSKKGADIFDVLNVCSIPVEFGTICQYNSAISHSTTLNNGRKIFFHSRRSSFKSLVQSLTTKQNFFVRIYRKIILQFIR